MIFWLCTWWNASEYWFDAVHWVRFSALVIVAKEWDTVECSARPRTDAISTTRPAPLWRCPSPVKSVTWAPARSTRGSLPTGHSRYTNSTIQQQQKTGDPSVIKMGFRWYQMQFECNTSVLSFRFFFFFFWGCSVRRNAERVLKRGKFIVRVLRKNIATLTRNPIRPGRVSPVKTAVANGLLVHGVRYLSNYHQQWLRTTMKYEILKSWIMVRR